MHKLLTTSTVLAGLWLTPLAADAHCDAIGGPVATAAVRALEARNVNIVLPYAPASAEPEMTAAFNQAVSVRHQSPEAKTLVERFFMETAVRLHRAGENAPYTGLKPAGTDFGPAIPAAERALETGQIGPLIDFLSREVAHGLTERFSDVKAAKDVGEPKTAADVPAAREHVREQLGFVGYIEGIYLATKGSAHGEGVAAAKACGQ